MLVPENLNSLEVTACCGKTLISLLWSLLKLESWFCNKETRKKIWNIWKQNILEAKNELHILYLLVYEENNVKKSLNKYDPWVSMYRLIRWLCQGNVFVLSFALDVVPLCLQWPLAQLFLAPLVVSMGQCSVFLRCLWVSPIRISVPNKFENKNRSTLGSF